MQGQSKRKSQKGKKVVRPTAADDEKARDDIFAIFDKHQNERVSQADVAREAEAHGIDITREELAVMVRGWDTSGTATLSRADFNCLWDEAK